MMVFVMVFVGEMVLKEKIGSVIGLFGMMLVIGIVFGLLLGGVLIVGFGWLVIFLINLLLGVLMFFFVYCYLCVD